MGQSLADIGMGLRGVGGGGGKPVANISYFFIKIYILQSNNKIHLWARLFKAPLA